MTQEPLPEYLDYHAAVPWLIENADEKKTFEGNRTIVTYKDANPNYLAWKVSEQLRYEELKSELSAALKRCDEYEEALLLAVRWFHINAESDGMPPAKSDLESMRDECKQALQWGEDVEIME